jgi:hypothetical protein
MLLVAPAATAFATTGDGSSGCTGVDANVGHCHTNDGGTTNAGTTSGPGANPMRDHPCAKHTPPDSSDDDSGDDSTS